MFRYFLLNEIVRHLKPQLARKVFYQVARKAAQKYTNCFGIAWSFLFLFKICFLYFFLVHKDCHGCSFCDYFWQIKLDNLN